MGDQALAIRAVFELKVFSKNTSNRDITISKTSWTDLSRCLSALQSSSPSNAFGTVVALPDFRKPADALGSILGECYKNEEVKKG